MLCETMGLVVPDRSRESQACNAQGHRGFCSRICPGPKPHCRDFTSTRSMGSRVLPTKGSLVEPNTSPDMPIDIKLSGSNTEPEELATWSLHFFRAIVPLCHGSACHAAAKGARQPPDTTRAGARRDRPIPGLGNEAQQPLLAGAGRLDPRPAGRGLHDRALGLPTSPARSSESAPGAAGLEPGAPPAHG